MNSQTLNNKGFYILFIFACLLSYFIPTHAFANDSKATAQINIGDEKNISLLIPLNQTDTYTTFTQGTIQNGVYSLGFGHRAELGDYLLGLNSIYAFDEDNRSRVSIGFEASNETYRLNANQYIGLDSWKEDGDYLSRTADGFDVRLSARPAIIPSVLGNISYEKFDGQAEKFKLGATYQPIPLLSFTTNYDLNNDEVTGYIQLTYRFGESLSDQLDAKNLPKYQSLKAQRSDLVQFSTELYQEKQAKITQQPIAQIPLQGIELRALNDAALINSPHTLEVKVYQVKNGVTYLLDDIVVKFKADEMILGVATTQNGLARLDFSSPKPAVFEVYSVGNEKISNTVQIRFDLPELPPAVEPEVPPVVEPESELPPVIEPEVPPVIEPAPELPPFIEPEVPPVVEPEPELPPVIEPEVPPVIEPEPELPAVIEPEVPPVIEPEPELPPVIEPEVPPVVEPEPELPPVIEPEVPPVIEPEPELPPVIEPEVPPVVETEPELPPVEEPELPPVITQICVDETASAVAYPGSAANQQPIITDVSASGVLEIGQFITVNYTYIPVVSPDSNQKANNTVFEFGPRGTTLSRLGYSSIPAGNARLSGNNSFTIGPLAASDLEQDMEVGLWAINNYYIGMFKVVLPILPVNCQ